MPSPISCTFCGTPTPYVCVYHFPPETTRYQPFCEYCREVLIDTHGPTAEFLRDYCHHSELPPDAEINSSENYFNPYHNFEYHPQDLCIIREEEEDDYIYENDDYEEDQQEQYSQDVNSLDMTDL